MFVLSLKHDKVVYVFETHLLMSPTMLTSEPSYNITQIGMWDNNLL